MMIFFSLIQAWYDFHLVLNKEHRRGEVHHLATKHHFFRKSKILEKGHYLYVFTHRIQELAVCYR